jgi:ribonuclease H / adenosylcobalamin/alpha-ribazole phosphatase
VTSLVHVVRHGRTALNADGRFRGLADPPLDAVGLAEAERTAERLAERSVSKIATSPLGRARQTARAIGRSTGIDPVIEPGLLDADMGRWQGLTRDEAAERDPGAFAVYVSYPRAASIPEGDEVRDVEARVRATIERLRAGLDEGELVVVSHELPIRLVLSAVVGVDGAAIWDLDLPTGSVTTIAVGSDGWRAAPA